MEASDESQVFALHQACRDGDIEGVRQLLDAGCAVNCTNARGWTPLHLACFNHHSELAELLVDAGADVDHPNCDGCTPLHCLLFDSSPHPIKAQERLLTKLFARSPTSLFVKNQCGDCPLSYLTLHQDQCAAVALACSASRQAWLFFLNGCGTLRVAPPSAADARYPLRAAPCAVERAVTMGGSHELLRFISQYL